MVELGVVGLCGIELVVGVGGLEDIDEVGHAAAVEGTGRVQGSKLHVAASSPDRMQLDWDPELCCKD
jgi:hypothetical protein